MALISNIDLLKRIPLFSFLTLKQIEEVSSTIIRRRFRRGELVAQQGKKNNTVFVLLTGQMHEYASNIEVTNREAITSIISAGDCFGIAQLLTGAPLETSVRAKVSTEVMMIDRAIFLKVLSENIGFTKAVLMKMADDLNKANIRIKTLSLYDVCDRVIRTLPSMSEHVSGINMIRGKLSRQDLAKHIGASREMVSRVLIDLEDRGLIKTLDCGSIVLQDEIFNRCP